MSEPRLIKYLHFQILSHPEYHTRLEYTTRWAFEITCEESTLTPARNKWARQIWRFLYRGEPIPL